MAAKIKKVTNTLGLTGSDTFRNANSVSMKLLNFRNHDPTHDTQGLPNVNDLEKVVWEEFSDKPGALKKVVSAILEVSQAEVVVGTPMPLSDGMIEAREGQIMTRLHRYRERDSAIVRRKKASNLERLGHLHCEACGFDFEATYGDRGKGFVECHHTRPVSELTVGAKTKLADLVLLCANCHRMVHSARPWLTFEELKILARG